MTTITQDQDTEPYLRLLRARSQLYAEAKIFQWGQFILTVAIPFVLGLAGIFFDQVRPAAAVLTLGITIADATFIDRQLKRMLTVAARVCERFDCDLYGIPWKVLVAGNPVDQEELTRAARAWKKGDAKLIGWYPAAAGRAPLELARLVCQRSNLWYDSELRRGYAKGLFVSAWLAVIILLVAALIQKLDTLNFILSVVPATPLVIWAVREGIRQNDAASANDTLKGEVEAAVESYIAGTLTPDAAPARAREIQDGIFQRRAGSSPLLLARLYDWRRSGMEHQMNEGANELVKRAGY